MIMQVYRFREFIGFTDLGFMGSGFVGSTIIYNIINLIKIN